MTNLLKGSITGLSFMALLALGSCGDSSAPVSNAVDNALDADTAEAKSEVTLAPEIVNNLLDAIPSPVETSIMIKATGGDYNPDFLNPAEKASQYTTSYKQSLNLGIYGTDLGYTNIYGQSQDGVNYVNALRDVSKNLKIDQFFDLELIARLANNNDNVDSLLMITQTNFQEINKHLQGQQRSSLSLLIITGGWLEGLHLITEVLHNAENEALKEKVGEQKIILDNLMLLLDAYKSDAFVKGLYDKMMPLKQAYDEVKIVEEYQESKMEMVDGIPMIVGGTTTTVYITDEQLADITAKSNAVRDYIISL